MKIYIVSFDLQGGDARNYESISAALEKCGNVNHFQKSACLVASKLTAKEIRGAVLPELSGEDSIFVGLLEGEWAGRFTRVAAWVMENSK